MVDKDVVESATLLLVNSSRVSELDHKIKKILRTHVCQHRSSRTEVFFKIDLLKDIAELTEKNLC